MKRPRDWAFASWGLRPATDTWTRSSPCWGWGIGRWVSSSGRPTEETTRARWRDGGSDGRSALEDLGREEKLERSVPLMMDGVEVQFPALLWRSCVCFDDGLPSSPLGPLYI